MLIEVLRHVSNTSSMQDLFTTKSQGLRQFARESQNIDFGLEFKFEFELDFEFNYFNIIMIMMKYR